MDVVDFVGEDGVFLHEEGCFVGHDALLHAVHDVVVIQD